VILRWQEENGISRKETQAIRAPEGQRRVPMSREFLRLFEVEGWEDGDHSNPGEEFGLRRRCDLRSMTLKSLL
jgi:hypothetical protein